MAAGKTEWRGGKRRRKRAAVLHLPPTWLPKGMAIMEKERKRGNSCENLSARAKVVRASDKSKIHTERKVGMNNIVSVLENLSGFIDLLMLK